MHLVLGFALALAVFFLVALLLFFVARVLVRGALAKGVRDNELCKFESALERRTAKVAQSRRGFAGLAKTGAFSSIK